MLKKNNPKTTKNNHKFNPKLKLPTKNNKVKNKHNLKKNHKHKMKMK